MRAAFPANLGWLPSQYPAGSKSFEAPHLTICLATCHVIHFMYKLLQWITRNAAKLYKF
jgi:hypothetical protein